MGEDKILNPRTIRHELSSHNFIAVMIKSRFIFSMNENIDGRVPGCTGEFIAFKGALKAYA